MTASKRTFKLVTGLSAAVSALILAGAWIPTQTHRDGKKQLIAPDASCDCEPSLLGRAFAKAVPQPKEWCLTQQRFDAKKRMGGEASIAAACAEIGPPDNPAVRDAAIPTGATPIKTYRLTFHVFRDDSGANAAASAEDVQVAVDRLNANYAPWRIAFVHDWRFINSTKYRTLASSEEFGMKKAYAQNTTSRINIYVVDTGGVCWGTFPWDPDSMGKQGGIVMDDTWFGAATTLPSILTHEVGHCVGLWHTFHGVDEVTQCGDCYEQAGRSAADGDTKGDLCSDTQPTLRSATACSDPAGTDPCSGLPWTNTPYPNYMSYSNRCAVEFTPHQAGRMHAWTQQNLMSWVELPPPPTAPGTPSLSTSGGVVTIAWADNSNNETGFEVQREKRANGNRWGNTATIASVDPNVTSTVDSPGAGTFRYRVRAFNADGYSAYSGWAQITN